MDSQRPVRNIQVDPFFDGGMQQRIEPPDLHTQYSPVDNEQSRHMQPGPRGLSGVVIPNSTMFGVPIGAKPHATADIVVNVDPHIPGQSSTVRLGDLSGNVIAQAEKVASQYTADPYDMASMRVRGAAVMHVAAHAKNGATAREAPQMEQRMPIPQPQPVAPPTRIVSPLTAFKQQPPQPSQVQLPQPAVVTPPVIQPPMPNINLPTVEVTFETEGYGAMTIRYHDVIIEPGFIVLAFDTRCTNAIRWFPPTARGDDPPKMGLSISGMPDAHLVQTTGIQFVSEYTEFCVVLIEETIRPTNR